MGTVARMAHHDMKDEGLDISQAIEQSRLNPVAFKPVYEAYFTRIYQYCLRRVGDVQEAEDLTSQVFSNALVNIASYRGGSFPAWLFRIAHNVVLNQLRARRVTVPLDEISQHSTETDPLDQLIGAEERQRVVRLMDALPAEQRNLLSLRITARLSAKEIGLVIGKSEGAVRVAIHRIIQHMRASWVAEEKR